MSESDKSGKQELTSDDFKRINEWVGEIYYKSPPHTDNWNELQGIAERATLHERAAAQARIAELETLRKTVEMLTSGLPVTNALDVKFIAEQAVRIKELEYENDLMKEELRSQSQRVKSWYSDKVRDILGLFQQPYRGAGFPIKPPKP